MGDVHSPQRPHHRRNASSKSAMFKSLVSPKSRPVSPETTLSSPTKSTRALGERQGNVQSPPQSPSKKQGKQVVPTKTSDSRDAPKKSKSSTNLASVFARINRSSKDLSTQIKDKENYTPPISSPTRTNPPIFAQYSSVDSMGAGSSNNLRHEMDRYTPKIYNQHSQRDFNDTCDKPSLRPSLGNSQPQSGYFESQEHRHRLSGDKRSGQEVQKSKDAGQKLNRKSADDEKPLSRKTSGGSVEQDAAKEKLNVAKRSGRVMAAVAALQGKNKDETAAKEKEEIPLDPKAVETQFEAVLEARNIPETMRQKMRSLTLRVKADFVKQDQGSTKTSSNGPNSTVDSLERSEQSSKVTEAAVTTKVETKKAEEDDGKSTKRSRSRSRAFTFSRGKKEDKPESSPSKKHRSQSRSRPRSIIVPDDELTKPEKSPIPPTGFGSFGRKAQAPSLPADFIAYLRKNQEPTKVEVGRLHKLRILLRNETVAWVDAFISQDGMLEIVSLLKRTMALEWREDHEDQLMHEALLCLKGICTTERAMAELNKFADDLFPALLGMLFDEEKKGPAEYSTRTIIINVLFSYLESATNGPSHHLEERARIILKHLGEPPKPEDSRPVDFVFGMRSPRPYKLWAREVSNVTKEVFWIFLHHLNVVALPTPSSSHSNAYMDDFERKKVLSATYTQRHFPGSRPPVPAAPYIGGVEWDATTYLTAHLDLLNGLLASISDFAGRNTLREELAASGFEKVMGTVLRTCKEKFYSGVHDGLRAYVAAAYEDGWDTRFVREGPSDEEIGEEAMKRQSASPKKSPKKKKRTDEEEAPRLEALPPKLDLGLGFLAADQTMWKKDDEDDGWIG